MKAQAPGTAAAGTSHQEHDLSSLVEPIPVASETAAVVPVASTASTEESELDVRLGRSFIPVTATVDCETKASFLSLLAETAEGEINTRQPICLVGLHACGDLTSSIVRVFIESEMSGVSEGFLNANAVANPALSMSAAFRIKSLVVVGCCYNRMTEWKPANATEDATSSRFLDCRLPCALFPLRTSVWSLAVWASHVRDARLEKRVSSQRLPERSRALSGQAPEDARVSEYR
eukprot:m.212697 g.212697  ORF g.212697 m.212697 type:complete len:233 (+) comp54015_c0_seq4:588-1286(+)